MKSLSSWLLAMFMFMFWVFRVAVAFQAQYQKDFGGFTAFSYWTEIILLFVAILCFVLFVRRNILGGILYIGAYGFYFGGYLLTNVLPTIISGGVLNMATAQDALAAAIGLIIAICVLFDLTISKVRAKDPKDKKTDWFFQNEQYDRKLDERADKNEYRNY